MIHVPPSVQNCLNFDMCTTIINNYSSSPNGPKAECAIDSEAMRSRGIKNIVLVKSKKYLSLVNFLPPKHYKRVRRFSLPVGYKI